MLTDAQVSVLCDIAQSVALAGDRQGEVDQGRRPLQADAQGGEGTI